MRYRHLRRLHLWLSLAAALPLLLLSLTGALLVYGHELQAMLFPAKWTVERPAPDAEPMRYSDILQSIARQKPDVRVWSFGIGKEPERAWVLWLADGEGVINLDPYSGRILHHYQYDETPYGFFVALHRRWLTGDPVITPVVRHAVSAVSLILILQMAVGLAMWLLPSKRLGRLKVDFRRSPRVVVLRLHQTTGVAMAVVLIAVAFTGMSLYWHTPTKWIVEAVTGQTIAATGEPTFSDPKRVDVNDIDAAVAAGRAALPGSLLLHFRAPQPGKPLSMGLAQPGDLIASRVWVGGQPPQVLALDHAQNLDAANWFWRARYGIHIGDFAGPVVRAAWVFVALLPCAYIVSGLWLYLHRRGRRPSQSARSSDRVL